MPYTRTFNPATGRTEPFWFDLPPVPRAAFPHFGSPEYHVPDEPAKGPEAATTVASAPKSDAARAADALERIAEALEGVIEQTYVGSGQTRPSIRTREMGPR